MKPILFPADATSFTTRGIGTLAEATACAVREQLNGSYELSLTLPVSSRHFAALQGGSIILAKPYPGASPQPFRVYQLRKSGKMLVTAAARHLSYDLDGVPVAPFTAQTAAAAVAAINAGTLTSCPFTLFTDLNVTREMAVKVPTAARALLGEQSESLLKRYGGELRYDKYSVTLYARRGADRGFVIAYGKNLVDFQQEENLRNLYTGVLPYWTDGETTIWGAVVNAPGSFAYSRVKPVDLSAAFASRPSPEQLAAAAQTYIAEEKIGVPEVSFTLNAVPTGSRGLQELEALRLGDTVRVRFPRLGVDANARVIGYDFDVLRERYNSLSIGDKLETAASTLSDASRLTRGTIPAGRYGARSIGGEALVDGGITVNKIANGAVTETKIAKDAVTGNKVLDEAISLAKLDRNMQVLWADIVATNYLLAGKVGTAFLRATNVYCTYLFVDGVRYALGTKYIDGQAVTALMPVYD